MDDPFVAHSAAMRLRRTCEASRLKRHFLSDAYERLVMLVTPEDQSSVNDDTERTEEEWRTEYAQLSETNFNSPDRVSISKCEQEESRRGLQLG